jgi:hypothetical protein
VTPGFIVAMIIAVAGASGWLSNIYLMFWKSLVSLKSKHKPIYLTAYRFLMSALLFSLVYLAVAELLKGDYTPFIYIRF